MRINDFGFEVYDEALEADLLELIRLLLDPAESPAQPAPQGTPEKP